MRFPLRDAMTAEQIAANDVATEALVPGKYYRFDPPVMATAIPTGGPNTCALTECTFERGWYLGFMDKNHVFKGKPVNDQREIPVPRGYEDDITDRLRDSYFAVLFIGGSTAVLDVNQSHN